MSTLVLSTNNPKDILRAVSILESRGLIATPTDTVYGLVASMVNKEAVEGIYSVKKRPKNKPLIVLVSSFRQFNDLASGITKYARVLTEKFWPGPLTLVVEKSSSVPDYVTCGEESVGIRFPKNKVIKTIIDNLRAPIVAPSANISGRPSTTSFEDVFKEMNGKIDAIFKGENEEERENFKTESTIVSLVGDIPKILREGAVPKNQIEDSLNF